MSSEATQGSANSDEDDAQTSDSNSVSKETDNESSKDTSKKLNESDIEEIINTPKESDEEPRETHIEEKDTRASNDSEENSTTNNKAGTESETDLDSQDNQTNLEETKKGKKKDGIRKPIPQLSNRLEYLARPKKDFLDSLAQERLEGAIPENAYPFWDILPLQTKIPFAQCPMPIARKQLGTNLFLPPPAEDFDLFDENNLQLPSERYDNMHDPNLKEYVRNKPVLQHLKKEGFVTESEKAICSLKDIHVYRRYQRRIQAAELQKHLRDEDEEFRKDRAVGMDSKAKRDMQRYQEMRSQGMMRRWIKNTVASIPESSMKNQMIRDMKVLNSQIRRQKFQKRRVEASRERYDRLFTEHTRKKYADAEKIRKETQLDLAKKDLERLEKLCEKQQDVKSQRKEKLEEFWKRKLEWQKEWIKRGEELEEMREEEKKRNVDILKRTGRLPVQRLNKENDSNKKSASKVQEEDQNHPHSSQAKQDNAKTPEAKHKKSAETEEAEADSNDSTKESLLKASKPRRGDSSETTEAVPEDILNRIQREKHG